jgi:hypothetical protein
MIHSMRCVVLGKRGSTYWMKKLLEGNWSYVELIESRAELQRLRPMPQPLALLATDSFPGGIQVELLREFKNKLSPKLIICLADTFDAAAEIELRCIGVSFLGSYLTFISNADRICGLVKTAPSLPAAGAPKTQPPGAPGATRTPHPAGRR